MSLYRFHIELSDIDANVYTALDFRVAKHPSESLDYLLTRVFAYALNWQERLEFSPKGLGDPDAPAIVLPGANGRTDLWIEIGNPSARKLHKASKSCLRVKVYTYKNPELLLKECKDEEIHRADAIEVFAFDAGFLERLAEHLEKDSEMTVLHNDSRLSVSIGAFSEETEIQSLKII